MVISATQVKLVQLARKRVGWNDPQYRMALLNAGGVESSKQLDQAGFENVMAILEDSGFADDRHPADYWRGRVAARGSMCGPRMLHKIEELAPLQRYPLPSLCERFSAGRTDQVRKLAPREAWKLIDMLKAVIARDGALPAIKTEAAAQGQPAPTSLFEGDVKPASMPV